MQNNKASIIMADGSPFVDRTDYARLAAMTDGDIDDAAHDDPDTALPTAAQLRGGQRLRNVPGDNIAAKLAHIRKTNKKLVSIRYDADVLEFFRAKGKGYQRAMNNVLREYMNRELAAHA